MSKQFFAVAGSDVGTCESLRWAWLSIKPMVLADGNDPETVLEEAIESAGHDDVEIRMLGGYRVPAVGDKVEAGKPGTEDYDTGTVHSVDGDQAVVGWDSCSRNACALTSLRVV